MVVLPRFWGKGKWALLLAAVIIVLLIARGTGTERASLSPVEILFRNMLAPLESGATAVLGSTRTLGDYLQGYRDLVQENKELKKEAARLNEEVNALTEAQLENVRLRQLLNMQESLKQGWQSIPAKVIGRDTSNWYHSVTINRGTDDGLEKGMAVINQDGLVGQVISVSRNSAEVLLILDKDGAVGCLVQLSRTPGVVEGVDRPRSFLRMIHVPQDAELKENQVVVTSGLGGVFPSGLRVGYVVSITVEPNGLMKQALVSPFVDFDRLEEVLVLKR
ncbi:MAG: rod shape-determining protein MreC [Desulfitobacteriaceae bacterium]|nr:rod shape-determining protein MreC [Desulfitobacteriaceae bacterium]